MNIIVDQLSEAIQQGDIGSVSEILGKTCENRVYCWVFWHDITDVISYVFDRDFQSYKKFCSLAPANQRKAVVDLLDVLIRFNRRLSGYVDWLGGPAYLLAFAAVHRYLDLMEVILNKMVAGEMRCSISFSLVLLTTGGGLLAAQFKELPYHLRNKIERMLECCENRCKFSEFGIYDRSKCSINDSLLQLP